MITVYGHSISLSTLTSVSETHCADDSATGANHGRNKACPLVLALAGSWTCVGAESTLAILVLPGL